MDEHNVPGAVTMKALAIAILFLACNVSLGGEIIDLYNKQAREKPAGEGISRGGMYVPAKKHRVTEIGIERTAGWRCYTFIVKRDGTFRYTGVTNVERIGEFTGTIDRLHFEKLAQFIIDSDYFGLKEEYAVSIDTSWNYTTVVNDGKRKTILNCHEGPSQLWAIEELIDSLIGRAKWNDPKFPEATPK